MRGRTLQQNPGRFFQNAPTAERDQQRNQAGQQRIGAIESPHQHHDRRQDRRDGPERVREHMGECGPHVQVPIPTHQEPRDEEVHE